MGSCLACKRKRKKRSDRTPAPAQLLDKDVTEITLNSSAHMTIKLTINPDNTTTYTISRSKQTNEKSGIEISNGEDEISIITSERAKIDSEKNIIPAVLSKTDTLTVANTPDKDEVSLPSLILPHPPQTLPGDLRRKRLRFRSQVVSSFPSSEPSTSTLSTEPSSSLLSAGGSTPLLSPTNSESDSPACSLSPEQTTAKNCSRSLPTVIEGTKKTEFRSLPGDSSGQFSKTYPLIITSTPPLPPLSHRNPITPLYNVGTPLQVPIYGDGDKLSFATFPKRIKLPRRFQGHFRCKECLHDWTSNYTWEGWGQICRKCKIGSSPCYPYRLNKLDYVTKITTDPHSTAHCLRCHFLKRTINKNVTCMSVGSPTSQPIADQTKIHKVEIAVK